VPLKYFPLLATCEFAGGVGLVIGILWRLVGIAAGIGLVVYFIRAVSSHLRVGDFKGIGAASYIPIEDMRLISDLREVFPYAINRRLRIRIVFNSVWSVPE
jgi:hypothetical protein